MIVIRRAPARVRTTVVGALALSASLAACGQAANTEVARTGAAPTTAVSGSAAAAGAPEAPEFVCSAVPPITGTLPTIEAKTAEYSITLSRSQVPAGRVAFAVDNSAGSVEHELAIIRADSLASLPKDAHGGIDEEQLAPGQMVGEVEKIKPGARCAVPFDLSPGRYLVVCNVTEGDGEATRPTGANRPTSATALNHAAHGMVAELTVG